MALPKADMPRCKADVEGWCIKMQAGSGCLNEDARQLVGVAAEQYLAMFEGIERANAAERELDDAMRALDQDPDSPVANVRVNVALKKYEKTDNEITVRHKLMPTIDKMVGRAQAASHAEADASLVQLRQFAERKERLVSDFGPAHKTTKTVDKPKAKAKKAKGST